MRHIANIKLKFLSFYYFWLVFLFSCVSFDFYEDTVTGFTYGYVAAFIYMLVRMRTAEHQLEKHYDKE